jgi:DNA-binding transcriptional LysR family regulator
MTAPANLNVLRAFEAAARHRSFSAAATELNVTPAAVGHQVRNLESWLGVALFTRATSTSHGLRINNSAAVLQAAMNGQGIALARSVMVKDDLDAGRLIRPLANSGLDCPLTQAYYVVYRAESGDLPKVQAFRDWLLAEAASEV